jgi:hypothetical protein
MKLCKYCGKDREDTDFSVAVKTDTKIYRTLKCKKCKQIDKTARRNKIRDWFISMKKTLKCKNCSQDDFRALTFHHRDPSKKSFNISDSLTWAISTIQEEIKKCDVLCANCHMILEYDKRTDLT